VSTPRPKAVLFDLLTALLDSWTLWDAVAGSREDGRRWRAAYLKSTYGQGSYRPYEALVAEAAVEVGLPADLADRLAHRYVELQPWPEVGEVLGALAVAIPLGVVTNCSNVLGLVAADRIGVPFATVVTAEGAGFYKPAPQTYRLALDEIGVCPQDCLFVAGSAYDLGGAAAIGMPVFWHDRIGMTPPTGAPKPRWHHRTLQPLLPIILG
jgi:2-haloalkanoic acid dehalogenase type II